MKILSPLDSVDEVDELAEAGAGEFYCGVLEDKWHELYPVVSVNRRPAGKGHFRSFEDLAAAVEKAHGHNAKVFLTLNEHYYVNDQYVLLKHYIQGAVESQIDALIVSDYGLMAYLADEFPGLSVHASTGTAVFNSRAASFFKDLGVERITLPRHMSLVELGEIIPEISFVETTVFILNSRCINVDGFCSFQHGLAGKDIFPMFRNACMLPFSITVEGGKKEATAAEIKEHALMIRRQKVWESVHLDDYPCGLCALFELSKMGVSSVKIVGRGNVTERKKTDVLFVKKMIDCLEPGKITRDEFRSRATVLYQNTYKRPCRVNMCYYPSVMKHAVTKKIITEL